MRRTMALLLVVALLALWITSVAHTQPAVGSDEQTLRRQLTTVARPSGAVTPTPTPPGPTATPTGGSG